MRVTDRVLQNTFLYNLNQSKSRVNTLQQQLATQSSINKPSDSPLGISRVMRLNNQIDSTSLYKSNIDNGLSKVDASISTLESMQSQIQKVLVDLTSVKNATMDNLTSVGEQLEFTVETLLDMANTEYNGQYLFSGTDFNQKPFDYSGTSKIEAQSTDIGGKQKIRISSNITQQVNITGKELFQSITKIAGNIDSGAGVGVAQNNSTTIYDADGNQYTMDYSYTQTAANSYDFSYSISDGGGPIAGGAGTHAMVYNATTGALESIDGSSPDDIRINIPANKIDFLLDTTTVTEQASAANLGETTSQKADIFNTLLSIKDMLKNGQQPNDEQVRVVEEFNQHMIDKLTDLGGIKNRLEDMQDLLDTEEVELQELLSKEQDVDVAKAIIDLENQQYNLDLSYKISSMILPKSLLDYL